MEFRIIIMRFTLLFLLLTILLLVEISPAQSQDSNCDQILNDIEQVEPGLSQKVSLSVSQLPLKEFLRTLANLTNINLTVDPNLDGLITYNFVEVSAKDILAFICKEYEVAIDFSGKIIMIKKEVLQTRTNYSEIIESKINYNKVDQLISLNLKSDTLSYVTKQITALTGANIILSPEIQSRLVTIYIQDLDLDYCLKKITQLNALKIKKEQDAYIIEPAIESFSVATPNSAPSNKGANNTMLNYEIEDTLIKTLYAYNASIQDIINKLSKELDKNFFLYSDLSGQVTINLNGVTYDELLEKVLCIFR